MIATLLQASLSSIAEAYFAIRVILIAALIVLVICIMGDWLIRKRVNRRSEDAEDRENE